MSSYSSQYPPIEVNPEIKQFFEKFYQISDTADAHEQYADSFTKDATLIMASAKLQGRDGLYALTLSVPGLLTLRQLSLA